MFSDIVYEGPAISDLFMNSLIYSSVVWFIWPDNSFSLHPYPCVWEINMLIRALQNVYGRDGNEMPGRWESHI